jgi:hypothetical protein
MATLARRVLKMLLFIGLFLTSMRFVHTYPLPMPIDQQQYLIEISEMFGVRDYEGFYLSAVTIVNLIVTIVLYVMIMKIWRRYWSKRRPTLEY